MASDHRRTSAGVTTRRRCSPRRVAEITAPSRPSRVSVPVRLTRTRPRRADGLAGHDHNDPAAAIRRAGNATTRQLACGVQAEAWASPGPGIESAGMAPADLGIVGELAGGWLDGLLALLPDRLTPRSCPRRIPMYRESRVAAPPSGGSAGAVGRPDGRARCVVGDAGPVDAEVLSRPAGAPPAPAHSRPQPAVRGDPVPVGGSPSGASATGGPAAVTLDRPGDRRAES
jgi:hypothetical protein